MLRYVLASLQELRLDGQPLSGTISKYGDGDYRYVGQHDANCDGFRALCSALAMSRLGIISLRSCHLGHRAVKLLAQSIEGVDSLIHLDICGAAIDEDTLERVHRALPSACTLLWEAPTTDTSDSDEY